mmetsp:Transcript_65753/g.208115  ORF Transcript_65753/g.208115 Transcript_65753/m.208115 type:complete len:366 (-) Transcript_65753:189-1286(-)
MVDKMIMCAPSPETPRPATRQAPGTLYSQAIPALSGPGEHPDGAVLQPPSEWSRYQKLSANIVIVLNHHVFRKFILSVIFVNAICIGVSTYDDVMDSTAGDVISRMDQGCLAIFIAELLLHFIPHIFTPRTFFHNPWNVFDLVVRTPCPHRHEPQALGRGLGYRRRPRSCSRGHADVGVVAGGGGERDPVHSSRRQQLPYHHPCAAGYPRAACCAVQEAAPARGDARADLEGRGLSPHLHGPAHVRLGNYGRGALWGQRPAAVLQPGPLHDDSLPARHRGRDERRHGRAGVRVRRVPPPGGRVLHGAPPQRVLGCVVLRDIPDDNRQHRAQPLHRSDPGRHAGDHRDHARGGCRAQTDGEGDEIA